jgi:hypothetical protein
MRWLWPAAAIAAFAFLVAAALHGGRPDILVEFKPTGLLRAFPPEQAREIEIVRGSERRRFTRESERWNAAPEVAQRLDAGLRLLRDSGPLRVLTAEEIAKVPPSEYALGSDSLKVSIRPAKGATFVIQFGGRNPLGAARYAKVDGEPGIALLPIYVAEPWEQVK